MGESVLQLKKHGLAEDGVSPASTDPRSSQDSAADSEKTVGGPGLAVSPSDYRDHPVLPWVIKWMDGAAVVSATLVTAWVGSRMLTRQQAVMLAEADLVAVLVFFLSARNPRLPFLRLLGMGAQQMRLLAPSLVLAALVQAGVFWWAGWTEPALMRASCAWMLAVTAGLIATRSLSTYALRHPAIEQRLTRKIAIIGNDVHAFRVADRLGAESKKQINVVGVFDDCPQRVGQDRIDGSIADLISLSREIELDGIIIALPPAPEQEGRISALGWQLRSVLADVFVAPYLMRDPDILLPVQPIGPMAFMVLQRRPLDEWQAIRKRAVDIIIGLLAVVLLLPLFVAVAIAIKLDSPGPVLFRQPRRGFNNRQFTVFKFRSMYASAADYQAARQTSRDDPRVTRVGKWLRRLSIDELPQLLNVLRGEMSLVGPRPHATQTRVDGELLNDVIADYILRYQVKPGITGWAQVNGARGALMTGDDLRRRVAYDLDYIQHWSVAFDLKIIALTATREIMSKHAF